MDEGVVVAVLRRACAVLLAAPLMAGCGLGDRQQQADAIIDSSERAFAERTATGVLTTSMRFVRLPDGAGGILGAAAPAAASDEAAEADPLQQFAQAQQQQMQQDFGVVVSLDLANDQASVALPNKADAAFAIYDGLISYGRRWSAGPRDARPWVRVDSSDINEGEEIDPTQDAPSFFTFAINPVRLVDLIAGPLSGSVRKIGTETIGEVSTTHYTANFDIEKVTKDTRRKRFPEDTRKAFEDVLDVLAVAGSIHEGEVWIDDEGRPRQFTIRLEEEPIKHFVIEHTITLQLHAFGGDAAVTVPTPRERVDLRSVVQFLRATIPSPQTPEFLTFLGVAPPATAETTTTTTPITTTTVTP